MTRGGFAANADGARLFNALDLAAVYDDDYLAKLVAYRRQCPRSEKFDVLYARYALAHGAVDVALEHALRAYERRKADAVIWRILAECYERRGELRKAALFRGLLLARRNEPLRLDVPRALLADCLDAASVAASDPRSAPKLDRQLTVDAGLAPGMFLGQFLPDTELGESPRDRYFSGLYVEDGLRRIRPRLMQHLRDCGAFRDGYRNADLVHELQRGVAHTEVAVAPADCPVVVPLVGTVPEQEVQFRTPTLTANGKLGQWSTTFFRLDEPTSLRSQSPFVVGGAIPLRHSPRRRKVVLNILLDALCWSGVRGDCRERLPNVMRFFDRGVIFDNCYSVSEYTYPSVPTIETGLMPTRTQMFNHNTWSALPPTVHTLSERMRDAGYFCTTLLTHGDMVFNGVLRGHARQLISTEREHAYVGVERAIQQLTAFHECDNFIFLHISDTHPDTDQMATSLCTQTHQPLADHLAMTDSDAISMTLARSPVTEFHIRRSTQLADDALGRLFDFLARHYREDEYVVHLYSDHGAAVYNHELWYVNEAYTHATLMVRGGGVPRLGLVPELVSTADIFPIVLRNAGLSPEPGIDGRLPRALGGEREREFTASYSVFTGQTCKLCLRDRDCEFRLETEALTQLDNRADFSAFTCGLFTRDAEHRPVDDAERERRFLEIAAGLAQDLSDEGQIWNAERPFRLVGEIAIGV